MITYSRVKSSPKMAGLNSKTANSNNSNNNNEQILIILPVIIKAYKLIANV